MIDTGIGAHEAVACFGDQHVIAADDSPRLFKITSRAEVLLLPLRDGLRLERGPDCGEPDYGAFGLGNNFLRDDEDVAVSRVMRALRAAFPICPARSSPS